MGLLALVASVFWVVGGIATDSGQRLVESLVLALFGFVFSLCAPGVTNWSYDTPEAGKDRTS